jgi:hypothetical protein
VPCRLTPRHRHPRPANAAASAAAKAIAAAAEAAAMLVARHFDGRRRERRGVRQSDNSIQLGERHGLAPACLRARERQDRADAQREPSFEKSRLVTHAGRAERRDDASHFEPLLAVGPRGHEGWDLGL